MEVSSSFHTRLNYIAPLQSPLLRQLNESGKRRVPKAAPTDFVKAAWKSLVLNDEGQIQRRHYELCVLWEQALYVHSQKN